MKLVWSTLRVKDLDATIAFYQEVLGLQVTRRFAAGPGTEIAFMGAGGVELEFIADGSGKETNAGTDISWGFAVDSLSECMALLEAKGIAYDGPTSPNPTVRFIFISDPDGMRLQFAEQH